MQMMGDILFMLKGALRMLREFGVLQLLHPCRNLLGPCTVQGLEMGACWKQGQDLKAFQPQIAIASKSELEGLEPLASNL